MKKMIIALALMAGCGANMVAVEHAEVACLEADYASLKAKLAAGMTSASGEALTLTEQEMACAIAALDAKAPTAADAGTK